MLPIESFSIENFRSFGPKQQLPLSRINFLFGPNSHGKSSSLMGLGVLVNSLLKNQFHQDKIEHSDNSPIIEMKGDLVNNKSGSKYFELGCSLPYKKEGDSLEINFKVGSLAKGYKEYIGFKMIHDPSVVNLYGLSIQRNGESVFNIDSKGCEVNFDSELIQGFFSKNEGKRNIFEDYGEKEGAHSLEVRLGDVGLDIVQKRSEIDGISSSSFRSMSDQYFVSGFLDDLLIKIAKVFQHRKISWIGANRNVTSQKLIINSESGFIADSYLNKQAITELNKWLKTTNIINLGYQFILNEVKSIEGIETDDLTLTEFGVKKDDKLYALNEVGSGISHVFQILISVFNKPELLIIQQPELHLHPSLQVQLINSIISLSKQFGIQVVIETHSEHVIKAAQLEISKGVSSDKSLLTAEELNVLYISKNKEGFSSVKKIEVDKTGSFTEPWPDDFFELSADLGLERLRQGYKSKN